jgi:branched-chain amino acid transport system ATP-binding protein
MSAAILMLEAISKSFGGMRATDDLSLEIREGELHAIIGPNGAGKTTLIHQISGLLRPDSGRVLYRGTDITVLPIDARARQGLVRTFQIVSILPRFSVLANVAVAVQAHTGTSFRFFDFVDRDAALNGPAMEALAAVGLSARAHVPAGALSHGEKRQLEIAMALAAKPRLLLLDEPLAGTGQEEAERVISLLHSIKGQTSIILVEHDMNAVFALADRISALVYGKIIATGTPDEIRASDEVRRAYLGENAA